MKKIIIITTLFLAILVGAAGLILVLPYYFYNQIISNKGSYSFFTVEWQDRNLLIPATFDYFSNTEKVERDLWKKFHFVDVVLPLPVTDPFYQLTPLFLEQNGKTDLGVKFHNQSRREIASVLFKRNSVLEEQLDSQKIFQFPLTRNHLLKISRSKIWNDLFEKKMKDWNISFGEMIYNLYLIQLRSVVFPKTLLQFGTFSDGVKAIQTASENRDYLQEIIFKENLGTLYSYQVLSEKENTESQYVRDVLIKEIEFQPSSTTLARIIYQEFKSLTHKQKADSEGMLYLLSAWSHAMNEPEYIKEMVYYLERGPGNLLQLDVIYRFAKEKFGKTFSQRSDFEGLDSNIDLDRRIEAEERLKETKIEMPIESVGEKKMTPEDILKEKLYRGKQESKQPRGKLRIQ